MNTACEKCGAALAEGQAFCTVCGSRQSELPKVEPAQTFCVGCGSPLDAGAKFCVKCGASTLPAAGNAPARPAASGASPGGGTLLKVIMVIAAIFVFFVLLAMGSCAYIAYRAKKKADALEQAYKSNDMRKLAGELGLDERNTGRAKNSTSSRSSNAQPAMAPGAATGSESPLQPSIASLDTLPPGPLPVPVAATGNQAKDWALKYERTSGGPEADLVVRTGDINNLGFDWPPGFDPFSGDSTPPHPWPQYKPQGEPDGTDRVMVGSGVTLDYMFERRTGTGDGYSGMLLDCGYVRKAGMPPCAQREASMPKPIILVVGVLPTKIDAVLVQIFVDDFQAPVFHSHFQVRLNGTRIPTFEDAINVLDQTGPIGKLITLRLLPEYWPLLQSGTVRLFIDDPTTHARDGYAIDFVRILVNPHKIKYEVSVAASVVDADTHAPISGATVTAALETASTDRSGHCLLSGLPAGLVVATAIAPEYDPGSVSVDLKAGEAGKAEFQLHRHKEDTASLEQSIAQTGSVNVYGIHFDTGSAKLRPDSLPALQAVLGLINGRPGSSWIISGHTDNQGSDQLNIPLSESRAASVMTWLTDHGVAANRLQPKGFGASRPVADNATANGRALNRRVEIALASHQ